MSTTPSFFDRELPETLDRPGYFRLAAAVIIGWLIFWWGSVFIGLPPVPYLSGSLITLASPAAALGAAAAGLFICTVIGKFVVGDLKLGQDVQFEGGLVAALVAMFALAMRVGSSRYAMFAVPQPSVFLMLAGELVLLYVAVLICWLCLRLTASKAATPQHPHEPMAASLMATAMHIAVMAAGVMLFCQSEAATQGLAAVGISSLLASMAAHIAFPVRRSIWYWIGPLVVGVAGYVWAYFNPDGMQIGFPSGILGALARPSPLAYATAGPAGAIFGFWVAYRWNVELVGPTADAPSTTAA